VKSFQQSL